MPIDNVQVGSRLEMNRPTYGFPSPNSHRPDGRHLSSAGPSVVQPMTLGYRTMQAGFGMARAKFAPGGVPRRDGSRGWSRPSEIPGSQGDEIPDASSRASNRLATTRLPKVLLKRASTAASSADRWCSRTRCPESPTWCAASASSGRACRLKLAGVSGAVRLESTGNVPRPSGSDAASETPVPWLSAFTIGEFPSTLKLLARVV